MRTRVVATASGFLLVLALVVGWAPAAAVAAQHQNANFYQNWSFNGASGFWNIDQELRVAQRGRSTYWAQTWTFTGRTTGGYLGLQTNGGRVNGTSGDTAVFSLWNANGSSGSCAKFSGEGSGISCRIPYAFNTTTTYRLRVWRLSNVSAGQWWGAWILNESTGVDTEIGAIRVDSGAQLMAVPQNFVEYFGNQMNCRAVPTSIAYFTQPAANLTSGAYQYYSHVTTWARGACTGGAVTSVPFGETRAAKVSFGGTYGL